MINFSLLQNLSKTSRGYQQLGRSKLPLEAANFTTNCQTSGKKGHLNDYSHPIRSYAALLRLARGYSVGKQEVRE